MDAAGARTTARDLPDDVLATLAEIGEEISSSLDLDKVLGRVASLVKRLMDSETLGVLLLDPQTQTLVLPLRQRLQPGGSRELAHSGGAGNSRPGGVDQSARACGRSASGPAPSGRVGFGALGAGRAADLPRPGHRRARYAQPGSGPLQPAAGRDSGAAGQPPVGGHRECAPVRARAGRRRKRCCCSTKSGREASAILDSEQLLRRAAELVKRVIDYQIMSILLYDPATKYFLQRLAVKYGQSVQGKLRVHVDRRADRPRGHHAACR